MIGSNKWKHIFFGFKNWPCKRKSGNEYTNSFPVFRGRQKQNGG